MKVIKAIYNFIVGDMIILIGITVAAVILALIGFVSAFSALKPAIGAILVVAVLAVLTATLTREAMGNR
jgi:hypothetical protein